MFMEVRMLKTTGSRSDEYNSYSAIADLHTFSSSLHTH
jgi:hypothetical protein